jgi:predicted amidophosphoribosyltransferase
VSATITLPASDVPTCLVCDGPTHAGFAVCFCCSTLVRQLRMPLVPLESVTGYRLGDVMHRRLRGYKDSPVAEARHGHEVELGAMVEAWMAANRARLWERFRGRWDLVVTVPSSCRPSGSPADALVSRVPELARLRSGVLVRGPEETDHLTATRRGFVVAPGVDRRWLSHRRVLVFDDSVVTGARAQSAAAALRLAGAPVVGVVTVGRVVFGGRLAAGGHPARPWVCSSGSSPSPNRGPPTTSYWR